jgi:endoglucanase
MRRAIRTGLFLFASIASLSHAGVVKTHGALQAKGNQIVDAKGNPIQLAGMSLYWPLWGGEKFFTSGAVSETVKRGATLVRVPMAVGNGNGSLYTGNTAPIKAAIDAAIANDIYVIIDWHVEQDEPQIDKAVPFFTDMANTYGKNPHVIFEIWNEPAKASWNTVRTYANTVIAAIRKSSSNLVIVGSPDWSKAVDQAANNPVTDPNVAYTFHFYACTHGATYRTKVANAATRIPIFFTEWGTTEASGGGSVCISETDAWLQLAKDKKISWANWSLSDKAESSAALKGGASTNGGWNDGNLTPSGTYVFGKIKEIVPGTADLLDESPRRELSVRNLATGIEVELPANARILQVLSLDGRELSRRNLSGEASVRIPRVGNGAMVVRVTSDDASRTTKLVPVR